MRTFFRISTGAFAFAHIVANASGKKISPSDIAPMETLHLKALEELEKPNPDINKIDELLLEMENQAVINSKKNEQNDFILGH